MMLLCPASPTHPSPSYPRTILVFSLLSRRRPVPIMLLVPTDTNLDALAKARDWTRNDPQIPSHHPFHADGWVRPGRTAVRSILWSPNFLTTQNLLFYLHSHLLCILLLISWSSPHNNCRTSRPPQRPSPRTLRTIHNHNRDLNTTRPHQTSQISPILHLPFQSSSPHPPSPSLVAKNAHRSVPNPTSLDPRSPTPPQDQKHRALTPRSHERPPRLLQLPTGAREENGDLSPIRS